MAQRLVVASHAKGARDLKVDSASVATAKAALPQRWCPWIAPRATLQQLLDAAIAQEGNWRRITLPMQSRGDHVDVQVELKSSERRAPRRTLALSTADASVISAPPVAASVQSPGQRARSWLRFVHTGEQYGIVGQTIAGLASLAACFLVYTGLAWRRLIVPLFRRSA